MDFISASGIACAAPTRAWAISRGIAAALGLLLIGAAPPPAPLPAPLPARTGATATLDLAFTDLRSHKGYLQVCIAPDAGSFPDCRDGSHAIKRTIPAASPSLRLEGLAPGTYAVAVIHDANGNAKLDTMLGIPREGFGFSRNPRIGFGPPRFSAAGFPLAGGTELQQVRIRYLL